MRNKLKIAFIGFFVLAICLLGFSCSLWEGSKTIPTLNFTEYGLEVGQNQIQEKSDLQIDLEVVRLSNFYDYPELFSFRFDDLPDVYAQHSVLKSSYKPGPLGKSWEYPFATPDGRMQLLFCFCKIQNNTKNILRMGDARIYLILEGINPLPAISSLKELLNEADWFQAETNIYLKRQSFILSLQLPSGFFRSIVLQNNRSYKLINDVDMEILPGFSYEGILIFPVIPEYRSDAKISFFDITTKVDAAGNPVEKTQFDFNLQRHQVQMWLDRSTNRWRVGSPPPVEEKY